MESDGQSGYKRPPKSTRFQKGHSGNPAGRKPGRHREAPYDAVLGQIVTVTEAGVETEITAEDAFLRKMLELGLQGNAAAEAELSRAMEEEDFRQQTRLAIGAPVSFNIVPIPRGSVTHHLNKLGMATKLFAKQPNAATKIENWLVRRALERPALTGRKLSSDEQKIVMAATRNPAKMDWPDYWGAVD